MYSNMPVAIQKRMAVPNSQTTWSAAQLILVNEPRSFEAAPDLARLLRNKHNRARQYILWALQVRSVAQSEEVTPFVIECVNDLDPHTRVAAAAALAGLGPLSDAAITNLAAALRDSSTEVKTAAAVTLGRNGPAAKAATPDLILLLHDPSSDVRINAAVALSEIGGQGLPIEAIIKTLAAEAQKNSGIAIVQLHRIAPDHPGMRSMLMYVLRTDRSTLRPIAALDLATHGEDAKEAVPIILDLLEQSRVDSYSNTQYLQALERIDPQAAQKYKQDHPER
jgi:HEAT repeat protein